MDLLIVRKEQKPRAEWKPVSKKRGKNWSHQRCIQRKTRAESAAWRNAGNNHRKVEAGQTKECEDCSE